MKRDPEKTKKQKKQAGIALAVMLGLFYLYEARIFHEMNLVEWLLIAPLLLTAAAKFISHRKGDEGKMSRAYKEEFPRNLRLYRLFCGCIAIIPATVAYQNAAMAHDPILPAWVQNVLELSLLVLLCVSGIGWALTELIRRDFPWGVFRLIERLFYAALLLAGTYLGVTFVVMVVLEYLGFFRGVLLIVLPLGIFLALLILVEQLFHALYELALIIIFPNKADRDAYKEKVKMENYRIHQMREAQERPWREAEATDFWGRQYKGKNQYGTIVDVRKTEDGTYIDKEGNRYKDPEDDSWF